MKQISILLICVLAFSCTDAYQSKLTGFGQKFRVDILNCDGSISDSFVSSGKVHSSGQSDGYYFQDSKTESLIEVSGNIIISELK